MLKKTKFKVEAGAKQPQFAVKLDRWINPADHGWFSGDHHIHAAGRAHYTNPSEGAAARHALHVKGEGMNVGCCLTWPCYDYCAQVLRGGSGGQLSEPFTI
ncbi:MAG: hypothetical protein U0792_07755 [Gemmataceae bacterium]